MNGRFDADSVAVAEVLGEQWRAELHKERRLNATDAAVVLITGASGTGKTTIGKRLKAAGVAVIEADNDVCNGRSIARWVESSSGRSVQPPEPVPDDWCLNHEWAWRIDTLRDAIAAAANESPLVVVCGAASNFDSALHLFDQVLILVTDDTTIFHRVHSRTDHGFGKHENEYHQIVDQNHQMIRLAEQGSGIMVDVTRSVDAVLENILYTIGHGTADVADVEDTATHRGKRS